MDAVIFHVLYDKSINKLCPALHAPTSMRESQGRDYFAEIALQTLFEQLSQLYNNNNSETVREKMWYFCAFRYWPMAIVQVPMFY